LRTLGRQGEEISRFARNDRKGRSTRAQARGLPLLLGRTGWS
jgi:hypothetical protein